MINNNQKLSFCRPQLSGLSDIYGIDELFVDVRSYSKLHILRYLYEYDNFIRLYNFIMDHGLFT